MSKYKYKTLNDFFTTNLSNFKPDKRFCKSIINFKLNWCTKDQSYISFLSSGLFGVEIVSFSKIDDANLLELYNLNYKEFDDLQKEFYLVKDIDKNFNVASNLYYHLIIYTVRTLLFSNTTIPSKLKKETIVDLMFILNVKMFTALYNKIFSYTVDENIAHTVYEKLSFKYDIKKYKTWYNYFTAKSELILDTNYNYYNTLKQYKTIDTYKVITDMRTKISSMCIYLYRATLDVLDSTDVIEYNREEGLDPEGEKQIREIENKIDKAVNNLKNTIYNRDSFIDLEAISLIVDLYNNSINTEYFKETLIMITDEELHKKLKPNKYGYSKTNTIMFNIVEDVISISYHILQKKDINYSDKKNIGKIMIELRNYWSNSMIKNETIYNIKKYINDFIKENMNIKTESRVVRLSIAVILYMFLVSY